MEVPSDNLKERKSEMQPLPEVPVSEMVGPLTGAYFLPKHEGCRRYYMICETAVKAVQAIYVTPCCYGLGILP